MSVSVVMPSWGPMLWSRMMFLTSASWRGLLQGCCELGHDNDSCGSSGLCVSPRGVPHWDELSFREYVSMLRGSVGVDHRDLWALGFPVPRRRKMVGHARLSWSAKGAPGMRPQGFRPRAHTARDPVGTLSTG